MGDAAKVDKKLWEALLVCMCVRVWEASGCEVICQAQWDHFRNRIEIKSTVEIW